MVRRYIFEGSFPGGGLHFLLWVSGESQQAERDVMRTLIWGRSTRAQWNNSKTRETFAKVWWITYSSGNFNVCGICCPHCTSMNCHKWLVLKVGKEALIEQHDSTGMFGGEARTLNQMNHALTKERAWSTLLPWPLRFNTAIFTKADQTFSHSWRAKKLQLKNQGSLFRASLYLHSRRYRLAVGGSHPYRHSSLLSPGLHSQSAPCSCGPPGRSRDLQEGRGGKGWDPEEIDEERQNDEWIIERGNWKVMLLWDSLFAKHSDYHLSRRRTMLGAQ